MNSNDRLRSLDAVNSLASWNSFGSNASRELYLSSNKAWLGEAVNKLYGITNSFYDQFKIYHPQSGLAQSMWPYSTGVNELFKQHQLAGQQWQLELKNSLSGFTSAIKGFAREEVVQGRLHSEYWLIIDSQLLSLLVVNELYHTTNAVPFVINYYKADDWKKFEALVDSWHSHVVSAQVEVFRTAIAAARSLDEKVHLLTVPALIAQVDRLVRDLYSSLPQSIRKRVEEQVRKALPSEKTNKRTDIRSEVMVQSVAEIVDFWSAEILQEQIFSGLFRDSNDIEPEDSYSLFRHKIMHGDREYLKYQNEENFIRLMLYADFIVNLIKRMQEGNLRLEQSI